MADDLICVGVISGARGLRGEVRLKSFTADPSAVGAYGALFDEAGKRSFRIRVTGRGKDCLIVRCEGVEDRNAAEALKGVKLYLRRSALPEPGEEEYYQADLVGLIAESGGGERLGVVKAVHDFGAGAVLEISGGKALMIPFTRLTAPEVDVKGGRIVINPPPVVDEEEKG